MMDLPSTTNPIEEGSVSRNTMPSECESVCRNSSRRPAAALREMEGRVAEAMATPNNPERKLHEAEGVAQPAHGPVRSR